MIAVSEGVAKEMILSLIASDMIAPKLRSDVIAPLGAGNDVLFVVFGVEGISMPMVLTT